MQPAAKVRVERHFGDRLVRCFVERETNAYLALEHVAAVRGDSDAVVAGGTRLSYRQFMDEVARVATGLRSLGIAEDDRIALFCGNRVEFLILLYAGLRIGAVLLPIDARLRGVEVAHILATGGARLIAYDQRLAGELPGPESLPAGCGVLPIPISGGAPLFEDVAAGRDQDRRPAPDEEAPAIVVFTSGTTGRPKGATLTHINIEHSCLHFHHTIGLTAEDRVGVVTPITHVTGLVMGAIAALRAGATVLLLENFRAAQFLEMASRERMTQTVMVPAMYRLCLLDESFDGADLSAWRIGNYGGAPMPEGLIVELAERLPELQLINGYGASETCSPAAMLRPGEGLSHAACVGRPLPCADIVVMDEEGREVAPGEVGEIWIAGAMVSPGYWNDPEATARGFVGGYWRSGDLGMFDGDGYLRIKDRIKDVVNRGGYKVYSAEVESVLSRFDGVVEAAVVGRPSPVLGERVHAFVSVASPAVTEAALRAFCDRFLADYKVPESFSVTTDRLPRNAIGKLEKGPLRELARALPPIEPHRRSA